MGLQGELCPLNGAKPLGFPVDWEPVQADMQSVCPHGADAGFTKLAQIAGGGAAFPLCGVPGTVTIQILTQSRKPFWAWVTFRPCSCLATHRMTVPLSSAAVDLKALAMGTMATPILPMRKLRHGKGKSKGHPANQWSSHMAFLKLKGRE